nr:PREDICTED: putative N(4)-(beta-N-acetylglucosaminyl)-L-asparaginase GL17147 [Linepithema humile]
MDVGGVGGLRNVKSAISVARKVLENTKHSLLGGDLATDFAVKMKFQKESLQTNESKQMWTEWKANNCQPNFWKNVVPDPTATCGPYSPQLTQQTGLSNTEDIDNNYVLNGSEENHDTIGVLEFDRSRPTEHVLVVRLPAANI